MKRTGALTALALILSAGAANATDLKGTSQNDEALLPIPTASRGGFAGFYASLSGGMDFANTEVGYDGSIKNELPFGVTLDGIGSTGFIGDGQVGYDFQAGKIVFGVFGGGNISDTKTTLDAYIGDLDEAKAELTRDWGWYAGGRIGYATSKDTLVYVGGGYTQADFSLESDDFEGSETRTFDGYFGEVGIESRISGQFFAKAFGRYVAYNSWEDDGVTVDPSELQAMIGVTYRPNSR